MTTDHAYFESCNVYECIWLSEGTRPDYGNENQLEGVFVSPSAGHGCLLPNSHRIPVPKSEEKYTHTITSIRVT